MQSRSIPIAQSNREQTEEEADRQHNALVADYKDYCFYSRVVEGMRRQQGKTRDVALRYENQALIDHVVRTRHLPSLSQSPTSVRNFGDDSTRRLPNAGIRRIRSRADMATCISEAVRLSGDSYEWEDDKDLIFDIDI